MGPVRFRARMSIRGVNPYVVVSAARAARLQPGWRKPMPVEVRIDGEPRAWWRINLMPQGDGDFLLYLSAEVREASGTQVGDVVTAEVRFDASYRNGPQHPMPDAFRAGLAKSRAATKAWAALPPSRQKELLRHFAKLKSADALARNLDRALHVLAGHDARFMGRRWVDGR